MPGPFFIRAPRATSPPSPAATPIAALPVRRARLAAALTVTGLLALLCGCGSRDAGPFARVDGVWHYHNTPIAGADAKSFAAIDDHYAKDRARVYWADTYRDGKEYFAIRHDRIIEVKDADPATFKAMRLGYARDARNVYYEGVRFPVRDAATFELLDYGFARDRVVAYYHQAEIAGSEPASFAAVDTHYGKDARRVYYGDFVTDGGSHEPRARIVAIAGADPASFRRLDATTDEADAEDARATYRKGVRTPK